MVTVKTCIISLCQSGIQGGSIITKANKWNNFILLCSVTRPNCPFKREPNRSWQPQSKSFEAIEGADNLNLLWQISLRAMCSFTVCLYHSKVFLLRIAYLEMLIHWPTSQNMNLSILLRVQNSQRDATTLQTYCTSTFAVPRVSSPFCQHSLVAPKWFLSWLWQDSESCALMAIWHSQHCSAVQFEFNLWSSLMNLLGI